ncbi:hypothetical protein FDP41_012091 [Naegleria fowleri]|uniref:Hemerythrin-like domain-containing protein n=1 Tax=Naegleria fowleri TaxID=5763 RepID=A0A6A5C4P9_NAEFO|nr:uncharacterized protein FDP41_012091 [Naegleria fowleri]KAF0981434.1 hypothetical protein FDP41_012091 [Naegleria fowleri]CAG4716222.1 unnamed protein product [Naegleria fowleri]
MDGLSYLENDHVWIRDRFSQFRNETNWSLRKDIIKDIITFVCQHTSAEERYLYELIVKKFDNGKFLYDKEYVDNQVAKEIMQFLLDNLDVLTTGNFTYRDSYFQECEKLFSSLEDHMKEEENIIFPKLREQLSSNELSQLYRDLEWAKKNAPTMPHPRAPVTGAKLLHPVTGLVDTVTEQITGTSRNQ